MQQTAYSATDPGLKTKQQAQLKSSFRDPSGYVFTGEDGEIYRSVSKIYKDNFDFLNSSGLYQELIDAALLVKHQVVAAESGQQLCLLKPEKIDFISYPYEWCFSQLKDAALLTLDIQERALARNMSLKDASAYNVQFKGARAVFIDSLSFEKYQEGQAWVAYRQFCQHFLAPLALHSFTHIGLQRILASYIDGIPLDIAVSLLPYKAIIRPQLFMHLYLHAKSQKKYSSTENIEQKKPSLKVSKQGLLNIIRSLRMAVQGLQFKMSDTEWGNYYQATNYTDRAFIAKQEAVKKFVSIAKPKIAWDLGANRGVFSSLIREAGAYVVAMDMDIVAIEKLYQEEKQNNKQTLLPLVMDLSNPSSAIGWAGKERDSLAERGPADLTMALALIHHLAISGNVPLLRVAEYFSELTNYLIIEFVPKHDSQVVRLLSTREDIFDRYNKQCFEEDFSRYFRIVETVEIAESSRTLYLMSRLP